MNNISNYYLKTGDIKVDANELKHLINIINKFIKDNDNVDVTDKDYFDYFEKKYMVLNDIRKQEKTWFDTIKDIDKMNVQSDEDIIKINDMKNSVFSLYDEYKMKRRELQEELDNIKNKKFYFL